MSEHIRYATAQRVLAIALGLLLAAGMFGGSLLLIADADAAPAGNCRVIAHRALYQGTENQVDGVTAAATWFGAEVDAAVTSDGVPMGLHDARLGRLTGGASRAYIWEVTADELAALPHPYGPFTETVDLIGAAAATNSPILVTINSWGQVRQHGWADSTLDTLYAAAQAHPRPHQVFFGGFGSRAAMAKRHPDAALFQRYDHNQSVAEITASVKVQDIDLVALPKRRHTKRAVTAVRALDPTWVTTRQIENREEARTAQEAGIRVMQSNWPRRTATKWCR